MAEDTTYVYVIEDRVDGRQVVTVDDPEVARGVAESMVQDYYGRPVKWVERNDGEFCGTYFETPHRRETIYCYRFLVRTGAEQDTMLEKSEGHKDEEGG